MTMFSFLTDTDLPEFKEDVDKKHQYIHHYNRVADKINAYIVQLDKGTEEAYLQALHVFLLLCGYKTAPIQALHAHYLALQSGSEVTLEQAKYSLEQIQKEADKRYKSALEEIGRLVQGTPLEASARALYSEYQSANLIDLRLVKLFSEFVTANTVAENDLANLVRASHNTVHFLHEHIEAVYTSRLNGRAASYSATLPKFATSAVLFAAGVTSFMLSPLAPPLILLGVGLVIASFITATWAAWHVEEVSSHRFYLDTVRSQDRDGAKKIGLTAASLQQWQLHKQQAKQTQQMTPLYPRLEGPRMLRAK